MNRREDGGVFKKDDDYFGSLGSPQRKTFRGGAARRQASVSKNRPTEKAQPARDEKANDHPVHTSISTRTILSNYFTVKLE